MTMIVIDKREKKEILDVFDSIKEPYQLKLLEEGDYTNEYESFFAERKRDFDLVNSLQSRHIFVQLNKMREAHPNVPLYLIFEGDLERLKKACRTTPGMVEFIDSFVISLAHIYGVQFINTFTMFETIKELKLIDKYSAGIRDTKVQFEPIHVAKGNDRRLANLSTVPMLGLTKAKILLDRFKSINNIIEKCLYEPNDILDIDGISKGLLNNLINMYLEENPYCKTTTNGYKNKQNYIKRKKIYGAK